MPAPSQTIVHIGLGKCATTSLQTHVFPQLAQRAGYRYNPPGVVELSFKLLLGGDLPGAEARFRAAMAEGGRVFISNEAQLGWQPAEYERFADRNLQIWGADATIVLGLRDPTDYMTSLYADMVRGGLYRRAQQFFLDRAGYEAVRNGCAPWILDYFSVDDFDLRRLAQAYQTRFRRVVLLPFETQFDLSALAALFGLDEPDRAALAAHLAGAKRMKSDPLKWEVDAHLAYARLTGKLGTHALRPLVQARMEAFLQDNDLSFADVAVPGKDARLSARRYWPILRRALPRLMGRQAFALPKGTYQNAALTQANRAFLAELVAQTAEPL